MRVWEDIGEMLHQHFSTTDIFSRSDCDTLASNNFFVNKAISGSTWKALIDHEIIKPQGNNFILANPVAQAKPVVGTGGKKIPTDDWIGKKFANNWEILRKISREEELEMGMGTHNAHFECINHDCGIVTCIEKTTLNDYLKKPFGERLYNCRKCNPETCKYKDKVRKQVGRDSVTADYSKNKKLNPGDIYGLFEIVDTTPSIELSRHQSQAIVKCIMCGRHQNALYHHIRNHEVACECFRNRSTGEAIVDYILTKHNIPHKSEHTFEDLFGDGGGALRYDFAILKNNEVIALVEFDGQQHFEEAGTRFNPTGKVQIHDNRKDKYALEHNIPLLRIPFDKASQAEEILIDFYKNL